MLFICRTLAACGWCIGRVYINVFCWVVFMIHYAWYLFVLRLTERNITQRDAIKAWLVFDTVCVVENEYSLSAIMHIWWEKSLLIHWKKKKRKKKKFGLIVQCAEWQDETAAKWTHFICLTIVLFPDSPAPGKDRRKRGLLERVNISRG